MALITLLMRMALRIPLSLCCVAAVDLALPRAGFNSCRSIVEYILEADGPKTTLRFKVGDAVEVVASAEGYTSGTIQHVFHKEPQFPPGHVVAYQILLEQGAGKGTTVYSPAGIGCTSSARDVAAHSRRSLSSSGGSGRSTAASAAGIVGSP